MSILLKLFVGVLQFVVGATGLAAGVFASFGYVVEGALYVMHYNRAADLIGHIDMDMLPWVLGILIFWVVYGLATQAWESRHIKTTSSAG